MPGIHKDDLIARLEWRYTELHPRYSMVAGSFSSSINNRLKSTSSNELLLQELCGQDYAGDAHAHIRIDCSQMDSGDDQTGFQVYPRAPDCPPFRKIPAVAIQALLLSFRSIPSEAIGVESIKRSITMPGQFIGMLPIRQPCTRLQPHKLFTS